MLLFFLFKSCRLDFYGYIWCMDRKASSCCVWSAQEERRAFGFKSGELQPHIPTPRGKWREVGLRWARDHLDRVFSSRSRLFLWADLFFVVHTPSSSDSHRFSSCTPLVLHTSFECFDLMICGVSGALTGKYSPENTPSGVRGKIYTSEFFKKVSGHHLHKWNFLFLDLVPNFLSWFGVMCSYNLWWIEWRR